jgi:predicted house-cleaning noncanonical NTP pyrophosphatase (MazG superfamily)
MAYERFLCKKLVRDLIITQAQDKGFRFKYQCLTGDKLIHALKAKLQEEAAEVGTAANPTEVLKELADLQEVMMALLAQYNLTEADLTTARLNKNAARGAFLHGDYLAYCDVPLNHPDHPEFTSQPEKYPSQGLVG